MGNINIRVNEKLKKQSKVIFDELGLDMTTAITVYLKAVVRKNGIPFNFEIPNKETLKALEELEEIKSGRKKVKTYSSVADLRKDLGV